MAWIELVSLLALIQFLVFGALVGRARGLYGVKAPATTGHEMFERTYRVQMNTLETLVIFLPAMWLASRYWSPAWVGAVGAVYLLGRVLYARSYIKDPSSRSMGYLLSMLPTLALLLAALGGMIKVHLIQ